MERVKAAGGVLLFERAPDAPPPQVSAEQTSSIRSKPIRDFDARDAYLAALDRDICRTTKTSSSRIPGIRWHVRVRAIVAARREAITWRRSRSVDTPARYWSYLRRYPNGFHANDARRRLAYLTRRVRAAAAIRHHQLRCAAAAAR
jgi:uncharacterized caspase-like protein